MSKINIGKVQSKDSYYKNADSFQYNLVITTWIGLFDDLYPSGSRTLIAHLEGHGLSKTIACYDDMASAFISQADRKVQYPGSIVYDIGLKKSLFLLRYPKRYTWHNMDSLRDIEFSAFRSRNNRAKQLDRWSLSPYLWQELQSIVYSFSRSTDGPMEISPLGDIPTGAVAEENITTKAEKALEIIQSIPFGYLPIPLSKGISKKSYTSRLMFVPKNYKALRGVCMEPIINQWHMTSYQKGFERLLESKKGIFHPYGRVTLHDQDRSRKLAIEGSTNGQLSTIDLTAASDSMTFKVFDACTPRCLQGVTEFLSRSTRHVGSDGKTTTIPLYIFATMGSRATMAVQSTVYWVIVCLANSLNFSGDDLRWAMDHSSIIGDDIILPTQSAETVIDLLTTMGFSVNKEKSFFSENFLYREACGVEAYKGEVISSCYWPRGVVDTPDQVCSLYNRVYCDFGYLAHFHGALFRASEKWRIPFTNDPNRFGFLTESVVKVPASLGDVPFAKIAREQVGSFRHDIGCDHPFIVLEPLMRAKLIKQLPDTQVFTFQCGRLKSQSKPKKFSMGFYHSVELAEILSYFYFLEFGPTYDSPLDKLLGVSSKQSKTDWICQPISGKVITFLDWDNFL